MEPDKLLHFVAGFLISFTVSFGDASAPSATRRTVDRERAKRLR